MIKRPLRIITGLFLLLSVDRAAGQNVTVTPSPLAAPDLGVFVSGTVLSDYTVDGATGAITRTGGNAFPTSRAGAVNTITVTCTSCSGVANNRTVNVTVTAGAPAGRFSIIKFTRANTTVPSGTTVTGATTASPLTIRAVFPNNASTKIMTFRLGMTFNLATSGGTGKRPVVYTVTAARVTP
jgi:hypothetical protein